MALFIPSHLHAFLASIDKKPKKSLSQNFLIDGNIVKKILCSFETDLEGKTLLEIGPGPGVLTEQLLKKDTSIIAVEKDTLFAKHLSRLDETHGKKLHVFNEDFLEWEIDTHTPKEEKILAIGSLPYSITSPILGKITDHYSLFSEAVFVIQDEVAKRATAKVGEKDYSSLSLFLAFYADVSYRFKITSSCFYPKPKVDSACIHMQMKKNPPIEIKEAFFFLVKNSFLQRRKMLTSSLGKFFKKEQLIDALLELNLPIKARPEELSFDAFSHLAKKLPPPSPSL